MSPSPWQASQRPPLTLNEARPVAALARLLDLREKLADRREQARVGRRIGSRRAADGALVDVDHLVEELEPGELLVRRGLGRAAVEMVRNRVIERVVDQRRFARARYAGHAHEEPHRELERDALEIVSGGTRDGEAALRVDAPPF